MAVANFSLHEINGHLSNDPSPLANSTATFESPPQTHYIQTGAGHPLMLRQRIEYGRQ